jgi:hypothetical protein
MSSEKLPDISPDPLEFLSPKLRELLRRLARRDRRSEIEEIAYLIEARAYGQHRDTGDERVNPPIPLDGLPAPIAEKASAIRISQAGPSSSSMPRS